VHVRPWWPFRRGGVDVGLDNGGPDVVVVAAEAVGEIDTRLPGEAVLAVAEVVSPSTVSIDRAVKPAMYADAGIPSTGGWSCMARRRSSPAHCAVAGMSPVPPSWREPPGPYYRAFAVELDPADLTRRIT